MLVFTLITIMISQALAEDSLKVRVNRWLEVRSISGNVVYQSSQRSKPATIGTKLNQIGEKITTGKNSKTLLALDTGVGFIEVAENTTLQIKEMGKTNNGGLLTDLQVSGGQIKLKLRRFTNQDSRLRIETPAGITGVRGTEFGISVQPNGKTGVATLTGSVVTSAEGQSVNVNKGFQSLIIPGEPPTPPVKLRDNPNLELQLLADIGNQTAQVVGKVDPVNLLLIGNQPVNTNREGFFDVTVAMPRDRQISASVITPLGKRQNYELAVP